eukprot:TRINITY_DN5248_c0_g1_i2.p2 TRINITY_DN5248_c0_g1~~TRINITY_DN5248_c0_g1_i2.p2  ORF type:complete len:262 (+),score=-1.98 TRINITY_DN5248_c0_g1_i2:253-1038(+)
MSQSEANTSTTSHQKLALIIGQSQYTHMEKLEQCAKDALLVGETTQFLGFQTKIALDNTNAELKAEIAGLYSKARNGDTIFIYYSGLGGQQNDDKGQHNFLFGVDCKDRDNYHITQGIELNKYILREIMSSYANCRSLIVLDACRIYPAQNEIYKTSKARVTSPPDFSSYTNTSSKIDYDRACCGYDIIFACQPGCDSLLRDDKYGYFASALSQSLREYNTWDQAIRNTIKQVQISTEGRQKPCASVNIAGEILLQQNTQN